MIGGCRRKLTYNDDTGSTATDLVETKIQLNNVILDTKGGDKFMGLDLKDIFQQIPMESPELMKAFFKNFPLNII